MRGLAIPVPTTSREGCGPLQQSGRGSLATMRHQGAPSPAHRELPPGVTPFSRCFFSDAGHFGGRGQRSASNKPRSVFPTSMSPPPKRHPKPVFPQQKIMSCKSHWDGVSRLDPPGPVLGLRWAVSTPPEQQWKHSGMVLSRLGHERNSTPAHAQQQYGLRWQVLTSLGTRHMNKHVTGGIRVQGHRAPQAHASCHAAPTWASFDPPWAPTDA